MLWEAYRHLDPERVLVVREPGAEARGFVPHLDRYPGATVVRFDGGTLPEGEVREWLAGLDCVYSAETFYDWHMVAWAAEAGVATVLAAMPEFYGPHVPPTTAVWAPTPWRIDHLPAHARLVPVPVAADRFTASADYDGPLRVLHVVGHRAAADRNGTVQLLQAVRYLRGPMRLRLVTQDAAVPRARPPRGVDVEVATGGVEDYWRLYDDADVLVMPRRYGGLSLPVQEALAAGLAVVMTDCAPNRWWPIIPVRAAQRGSLTTAAGQIATFAAHPGELARALNHLAAERDALRLARRAGAAWVAGHSWEALRATYVAEFARACS